MRSQWSGRSHRRTTRATKGNAAERRALEFLQREGLRLLARNFRTRAGELDLVMQDGECLVIVEVRYRAEGGRVPAALTVDSRKQAKVATATLQYIARHRAVRNWPVRFDVIAIDSAPGRRGTLQWIRDAFRA